MERERLKEIKEEKTILTERQKLKLIDNLFEEEDLFEFYMEKLNKEWYFTYDKTLDPVRNAEDDKAFPVVLIVDGEFTDALGEDFSKEILK